MLSSPVEARVEKILKRPGEVVKAGEEILALDTSAARLQLEKIEDQLARKVNEQRQLRISLEKSLSDLRGQIERQKLDAEASAYRAEQNRKLRADGLVSEQTLKGVEVESRKAEIELAQLQESVGSARRSTAAQLEERGPGIPEDVRSHLFTPFFSTKKNGRGLGLTLVQEILSQHGFEFSLAPGEEGGAEFRVGF